MFYNEEFETLPRPALEALQLKRLKSVVERVYASVPFYRQALDRAAIRPDAISTLADIRKLPFTYKQDMRDSYPYGLFAARMEDVVRIHASSGTTGKPTACHRGSAFGGLGLSQSFSQKWFESILWDALRRSPKDRPIILEGESRRIGRISLPGNMYEVMKDAIIVWCAASLETRVDRLIDEYGREEYREGMASALERISRKLGGAKFREISEYLERWELRPFMAELLNSYYDKVYYKTKDWQENISISLEDFETAERELDAFLAEHLPVRG
jgi:hypothetical protein